MESLGNATSATIYPSFATTNNSGCAMMNATNMGMKKDDRASEKLQRTNSFVFAPPPIDALTSFDLDKGIYDMNNLLSFYCMMMQQQQQQQMQTTFTRNGSSNDVPPPPPPSTSNGSTTTTYFMSLLQASELSRKYSTLSTDLEEEEKGSESDSSSFCEMRKRKSSNVDENATNLNRRKRPYTSKGAKECRIEGCTTREKGGGLCAKHGGGRPCKAEGCNRRVAGTRYCSAHGGRRKKKCSIQGCTKGDQGGGFCASHGGGKRCKHPDCKKRDVGRGFCWSHGGGKRCAFEGCSKVPLGGGFCRCHGGERPKTCKEFNCNNPRGPKGFCMEHE